MLLSEPWRLGLTSLAIGLNAVTVLAHTYYGFDIALPQLASHKKPLYNVIGLKWLQYGLNCPYDKVLLTCYVLGHLGFGGWYYTLGAKKPLLSTVVAPIATLLCVL
ncbi:hypothetical protein IFM46972_04949 [Aspergillus udagawae]|uniref:Uncharacterized protein n=1 Tax=Aspergillus udagawae TaxID=91492 RepID=A0A8H3NM35_9EURO|nr:hypothetical protein IFM46972_04949 [Aspergillus udagawae]